ncbi:hypothetical protein OUZ56_019587 [Daphnia magna]|uniref:Uncharacterized protein n=1 Tax=Daphnia magna TaxID=35525 RepID=A0ABQ9ZC06_9CRUS|nr:hypothetical protein OUZ56_019587 [Daphnia magna]
MNIDYYRSHKSHTVNTNIPILRETTQVQHFRFAYHNPLVNWTDNLSHDDWTDDFFNDWTDDSLDNWPDDSLDDWTDDFLYDWTDDLSHDDWTYDFLSHDNRTNDLFLHDNGTNDAWSRRRIFFIQELDRRPMSSDAVL